MDWPNYEVMASFEGRQRERDERGRRFAVQVKRVRKDSPFQRLL
jgi:hypothetical protein